VFNTLLASLIDISNKNDTVNTPEMGLTSPQNLKSRIHQLESALNTLRAYGTTTYNVYMYI
jgi:hypothetical protein